MARRSRPPVLAVMAWRALRVCGGLAASVYRSTQKRRRRTPSPVALARSGACRTRNWTDHIRQQIAASHLYGEGYRKLWARLRFAGVAQAPRRVRRVMGENGLLAPRRVGRAESKPHDGTIVTNKVNEMWGTDMTQTITVAEGRAYVFVAVEHANSEVVGIHAARSANRFEALEPVRQGVHRCFLREATPATVHSLDGNSQTAAPLPRKKGSVGVPARLRPPAPSEMDVDR